MRRNPLLRRGQFRKLMPVRRELPQCVAEFNAGVDEFDALHALIVSVAVLIDVIVEDRLAAGNRPSDGGGDSRDVKIAQWNKCRGVGVAYFRAALPESVQFVR